MNSKFHQVAVQIAFNAMPQDFKERFLEGFSYELLLENADVPYAAAKFGEPEHLHLGHSYKLALKGRDLHRIGEVTALDDVVKFASSAQELAASGKGLLVRYNIAKGTHYIIDLGTYPHVVNSSWDKYHAKFEDQAGEWIAAYSHIIKELVANYKPVPMRSVQNRARAIAEDAFYEAMDILPTYKRNGIVTDLQWANLCCTHVQNLMDWFATFNTLI